jgi:hypothetical protein
LETVVKKWCLLAVASLLLVGSAAGLVRREWHHRELEARFKLIREAMTIEQVEAIMGPSSGGLHKVDCHQVDRHWITIRNWSEQKLVWDHGPSRFEVRFSFGDQRVVSKHEFKHYRQSRLDRLIERLWDKLRR